MTDIVKKSSQAQYIGGQEMKKFKTGQRMYFPDNGTVNGKDYYYGEKCDCCGRVYVREGYDDEGKESHGWHGLGLCGKCNGGVAI